MEGTGEDIETPNSKVTSWGNWQKRVVWFGGVLDRAGGYMGGYMRIQTPAFGPGVGHRESVVQLWSLLLENINPKQLMSDIRFHSLSLAFIDLHKF